MKKLITFNLIALLIFSFVTPSFSATKLSNGNYEYTPTEIQEIRKTLQLKDNEIKYLKNLINISQKTNDELIKLKSSEMDDKVALFEKFNKEQKELYTKLIENYEMRIVNLNELYYNKDQQYELERNTKEEYKALANKLNYETNKLKLSNNTWSILAITFGIGALATAVTK